jgi:hypothetical protein
MIHAEWPDLDIVPARCLFDETWTQRGQLVAIWALKLEGNLYIAAPLGQSELSAMPGSKPGGLVSPTS